MRRAIHESYGPGAVGKHQACQMEAVVLAMLRTVTNPEMWEKNLQVYDTIMGGHDHHAYYLYQEPQRHR